MQFLLKKSNSLTEQAGSGQDIYNSKEKDAMIFTEPRIFGPIDFDKSTYSSSENIIDEIVLQLSEEEEIYLIKGTYEKEKGGKKSRITKMAIYTTFGQYVEFGKSTAEFNFTWEYFFNLRFFDGFIIGWNEKNISYLASLVVEKNQANYDEKNITLTDTTYIRSYFVEPMYLSPRYGKVDCNTIIVDDLVKLNILNDMKSNNPWFISEICVFYEKTINTIEVEYTNRKSLNKLKSYHFGKESN